ncbi:MAG: hypothetical protein KC729_08795 [Candidatus Eisenbacteria bacterium]|uniref:Uncharacterized protein n=1 Tax=Eiseniibacteriota bacterium TaxID=2212470 RepID=A0A956RNP5_UNCEI|nr:hypothetical protein [Candidatus Eisenbacteria bacterium]
MDRTRLSRTTRLVLPMLLMTWGLGCAWVRGPAGPSAGRVVLPNTSLPDSAQVALPDTVVAQPPVKKPRKTPAKKTTPPAPESTTPAPVETVEPPRVDISVQMSPEERAQLEKEARDRIRETEKIVKNLDPSAFSQSQQDALLTVNELVKSASQALDQGDVQAAESLARKALLLATDLSIK